MRCIDRCQRRPDAVQSHLWGRALDALCEPRLPHHAPFWLARHARFGSASGTSRVVLPRTEPLPVALTFDVEQDLGSFGSPARWETCGSFLDWLAEAAPAHGWRTTLFVQGSLVLPLAAPLGRLEPEHEIGLHGYLHELWGRPLWFGVQRASPIAERPRLLQRGREAFEQAGLKPPVSFRAPNLVADRNTLSLLPTHGFTLDSSGPAFRGCLPVATRHKGLLRIPVSADPRPKVRRRWGVPTWARFDHLNAQTVLFSPLPELLSVVQAILHAQDLIGCPRHLVLLAHPWEFANVGRTGCAAENRELLVKRLAALSSHMTMQFRTMSQLLPREPVGQT